MSYPGQEFLLKSIVFKVCEHENNYKYSPLLLSSVASPQFGRCLIVEILEKAHSSLKNKLHVVNERDIRLL